MNPTDLVHRMKQARNHNLYINPKKTKMHTEEQSDKIQTIKK